MQPEGLVSGPKGLWPRLLDGLEGSERRGSFLGGVADPRFPALLLGDREEELPEDDRERERRLVDKQVQVNTKADLTFRSSREEWRQTLCSNKLKRHDNIYKSQWHISVTLQHHSTI